VDEQATALALVRAIHARRLVAFAYDGRPRVVEPHTLGVLDGQVSLLAYQTGGESASGALPEWRRFAVAKVVDVTLLDGTFGPRAPTRGRHAAWDDVIAFVPSP
jgi:predicted DNA-binding transcriptional regulator YafY